MTNINDHFWSQDKTKLINTKINDYIWSRDIQTNDDHITIGHLFGRFQLCSLRQWKIAILTMNLYNLLNSNTADGFRDPLNPSPVLEFSKLQTPSCVIVHHTKLVLLIMTTSQLVDPFTDSMGYSLIVSSTGLSIVAKMMPPQQ